jgi:hypothetical protein
MADLVGGTNGVVEIRGLEPVPERIHALRQADIDQRHARGDGVGQERVDRVAEIGRSQGVDGQIERLRKAQVRLVQQQPHGGTLPRKPFAQRVILHAGGREMQVHMARGRVPDVPVDWIVKHRRGPAMQNTEGLAVQPVDGILDEDIDRLARLPLVPRAIPTAATASSGSASSRR